LPAEPVIIFCGGNANIKNASKPPAIRILTVEEKIETSLIAITNIKEKITKELASIIPGEPAVHLTAFMQTRIQKNRNMSPGNARDCSIPKMEKLYVRELKSILKKGIEVIFSIEKAMIPAATIW
jgi:hypothetical protein